MRKITILLALLLFAVSQGAFAQKTITGKVISSEDGLGMVGVPVVVKGTTIGTATDIDGAFTLNVPADATTIVVSFIGFKTVELPLGTQTSFEVTMTPDVLTLGDVVVTALGIQRDKKTLTYASQQVSGAEMMKAKDINFMNSLSGKTAGLEIKKAASGAGGSTRTVLRGSKSLSGLSEPLYVIDGVPMVNRKGSQAGMWGGVDEGDGLSQLNPEDIESVSVLKGSNAAVLYGSQGANGVVMITTKKGKEGAVNVNLSSATIFESVLTWPELQYNYGAIGNAKESWSKTPLSSYDDKFVKDFFQTGYNLVNNISISGGNNRTTAYFSYANTSARGVIPTNTYDKNNVTFKQSTKLFNDKVKISSNIMLTSERSFNRPANGYYLNTLTGLYFFPRQKDFNTYKNEYQIFNTGRNLYLQNWFVEDHHQSNPYWILNNEPKEDLGKRAIASTNVEWEIAKGFKFQARANYDYADKSYEQKHMAGSNATNVSANGRWAYKKYTDWLAYVDGIFTYNNYFGDFSVNALAGGSFQQTRYGDGVSVDNGTNSLMYPNEFYFQNIPSNVVISSTLASKVIKQGVFANAQLGFKEMIFLDLSGRNDWSSTLAGTGNDSYFYPAIGLSGVLSQMLPLPEFVSFAKVRGSYTTVANEVPFNVIFPTHSINVSGGVDRNTRAPFADAKPEMLRSLEIGTDWRFLEGKLGFDFTYYNINSQDQFIELPALAGSGYTTYYVNAGEIINKGIELTVDAEPVTKGDFSWKTALNFAKNKNTVTELIPEDPGKRIDLGSSEGYYNYIVAGGSFGDLYGYKFLRDDQGRIVLDALNKPRKTALPEKVGSVDPDFTLGWNNNFAYKQFSLSFLVNSVFGGDAISQTESMLDGAGVSKRSGDARDAGYVEINGVSPTGTAVTQVDPEAWYRAIGDRNGIIEAYVYDRTNVRLTQLALTYDLDVKALNLPIKSASVSLVGQNLLFLYKNAPYDPELTMSTGLGSQSLDNFNVPSTRTYGFNIKVNF